MKKAIALSLFLVCLAALPAAAQTFDWSSVGSAIVLDEGLTNIYDLSGPQVFLKANSVGEIEGRFPVTNTVGSGTNITPAWNTLTASLVDNHSSGWLTITLYLYDIGWGEFNFGRAAALAWILFIIILVIGLINLLITRRLVRDEGGRGELAPRRRKGVRR